MPKTGRVSTLPTGGILETSAFRSLEQLMTPPAACSQAEQEQIEEVVLRIASDLSLASNRDLAVHSLRAERHHRRPAGKRRIHISFKLTLASARGERHGDLLSSDEQGVVPRRDEAAHPEGAAADDLRSEGGREGPTLRVAHFDGTRAVRKGERQ